MTTEIGVSSPMEILFHPNAQGMIERMISEPRTVSELVELEGMGRSLVTHLLSRFEGLGLINQDFSIKPSDGRVITAPSYAIDREALARQVEVLEEVGEVLREASKTLGYSA